MAVSFLPAAALTNSDRPVLHPGEIECSIVSSVDITSEENPSFPRMKAGLLILTTYRLIWISESTPRVAVSIPLASIIHIFSPKKSIKNVFSSPRVRIQANSTPEGKLDERGSKSALLTLTIRAKFDFDAFLSKFRDAWRGRAWENTALSDGRESVNDDSSEGRGIRMPVVGLSGILRKEQEMWENTDRSLHEAFQDLNALMSKAKEMVMLAEKMRQKLLSSTDGSADFMSEEGIGSKQELQDLLLSIGIVSPVTKESAGALYHQQLSRQLADFVRIPLERAGGLMSLIDAYCLFNRARGTELISPDDMLQACSLWEKFDVPVRLRKFDSGVMVIQNKSYNDEETFSRIKTLVLKPDTLQVGVSATDAAIYLGIAPAMAKEYLLSAETKGLLCRDTSVDGFRFYINLFHEIDMRDLCAVQGGIYIAWIEAASSRA